MAVAKFGGRGRAPCALLRSPFSRPIWLLPWNLPAQILWSIPSFNKALINSLLHVQIYTYILISRSFIHCSYDSGEIKWNQQVDGMIPCCMDRCQAYPVTPVTSAWIPVWCCISWYLPSECLLHIIIRPINNSMCVCFHTDKNYELTDWLCV